MSAVFLIKIQVTLKPDKARIYYSKEFPGIMIKFSLITKYEPKRRKAEYILTIVAWFKMASKAVV